MLNFPTHCATCGGRWYMMHECPPAKRWRVRLRSVAGMWETYSGHVDVWAHGPENAKERALDELRRGAFSDRPRDAWHVESVICLDKVECKL